MTEYKQERIGSIIPNKALRRWSFCLLCTDIVQVKFSSFYHEGCKCSQELTLWHAKSCMISNVKAVHRFILPLSNSLFPWWNPDWFSLINPLYVLAQRLQNHWPPKAVPFQNLFSFFQGIWNFKSIRRTSLQFGWWCTRWEPNFWCWMIPTWNAWTRHKLYPYRARCLNLSFYPKSHIVIPHEVGDVDWMPKLLERRWWWWKKILWITLPGRFSISYSCSFWWKPHLSIHACERLINEI